MVITRSGLKEEMSLMELTVILLSVSSMIFLIVAPLFPMILPIKLLWART